MVGSLLEFNGQVWFSFASPDVWMFYRFVRAVAAAGGRVGLEWTPLPGVGEELAMATYLGLERPQDKGAFLHALLGKVHIDGLDPTSPDVVSGALDAAGLDGVVVDSDRLARAGAAAADQGVVDVPSLFRHGPVARIKLNPAALDGDVLARAKALLAVADDDGTWEIAKP